uniref:Uncharacterized protein n=1 Tax=Tanacetum cinerariifolium TaxID=118510 RepID=A0A6L2N101_TANCI|nr:hypothetical protein [Tanacetum cinerariifolium]
MLPLSYAAGLDRHLNHLSEQNERQMSVTLRALAHIVLAKKLDMASIAHVLLKLTPTQDPCASMGSKEIDHIGGGVAATNFGAIRVEQSERQGLDMTKLSSIHRPLTLFALSGMKVRCSKHETRNAEDEIVINSEDKRVRNSKDGEAA